MSKKFAYFKKKQYFCAQFLKRDSIMPKQAGTYKVRGKMDNRSYYKPKNSKDYLHRSINQQMSERVKTEPNFAVTRSYAAEFAAATNNSSVVIKLLGDRSEFMNKAYRSARLTRFFTQYQRIDALQALGFRGWNNQLWQSNLRGELNRFAKNTNLSMYNNGWSVGLAQEISQGLPWTRLTATLNNLLFDDNALKAQGIYKYVTEFYVCKFTAARYSETSHTWEDAADYTLKVEEYEHIVGEGYNEVTISGRVSGAMGSADADGIMVCPLLVFTAYKKFGTSFVKMRSLSTFEFIENINVPQSVRGIRYRGQYYPVNGVGPVLDYTEQNYIDIIVAPWVASTESVDAVKINSRVAANDEMLPDGVRAYFTAVEDGEVCQYVVIQTQTKLLSGSFDIPE